MSDLKILHSIIENLSPKIALKSKFKQDKCIVLDVEIKINDFPKQIYKLRNLKTLRIKESDSYELADGISALKKLNTCPSKFQTHLHSHKTLEKSQT